VIAEIKGKLWQTGHNLNESLEDNLTGNFFGALRYIPFDLGLRNILSAGVYPSKVGDLIRKIHTDIWGDLKFKRINNTVLLQYLEIMIYIGSSNTLMKY
jgi:hypothetical protein